MDDRYLIPANANRGKLLFGYFRPVDLVIFLTGLVISLFLLLIFQEYVGNVFIAVILILPALICIALVMPIPNQHNLLVLLGAIYNYYFVNRQQYIWKGWCSYGEKNK